MNKPHTAAEKAARHIARWVVPMSEVETGVATKLIRKAIDEAGAEQRERIDALEKALRPFAEIYDHLLEIRKYSGNIDVPTGFLKCASGTLAPVEKGSDTDA